MSAIIRAKLGQAVEVLDELNLDVWLTFVRETTAMMDPAMYFVAGRDVVWESAFLVHRSGEIVAIVGRGDQQDFIRSGLYDNVITYLESIQEPLLDTFEHWNPNTIAVNIGEENPMADGLTVGMYRRLQRYLAASRFADRLVSASPLIARVRGRKSREEMAKIEAAARETLELFDILSQSIRSGWTLRQVFDFMQQLMAARNLASAWSPLQNPGITSGGAVEPGHGAPDDTIIAPGHALRLDFGIKKEGYCSDLQRTWYVLEAGESEAPTEIRRAFAVVREGIEQAAAVLKPGTAGWEVDAAARTVLDFYGYPQYQHALGHQVGIWAHDGGSVLGPRWPRYGAAVLEPVEENQVYTLEFGIQTSRGYVAQEDMVVVTAAGCRFLAPPQDQLWLLRFD